jgi:hypothetical protein
MSTPDRDLAEARSATLDRAIDAVVARLVHVEEDPDLARRIANALPDRSRFGWLIPQFALFAVLALAAIVWTLRDPSASQTVLPSSSTAVVTSLPLAVVARAPGTALRTPPSESAFARTDSRELRRDRAGAASGREGGPLAPLEPLEPLDSDHERSLSPIEAISDLMISAVAPQDLPASRALALAPLEIAPLPLSTEPDPR